MITTLIAAAVAAAQPVADNSPAQAATPAQPMEHQPGQMHEHGQMGKMSAEDCAKCCEEMMAKMHSGHSDTNEHKH
ncbi:hypothetical protein [Sphingomonas hankyongi]|uniref:Uncharacterized protein n=1 Tax=Sphingomonas hankyongi TaxID=2908209 RepID=A0ABT0S1T1_9SPHN|nr:hypothetical protein [Sphingomonas hankyongi]MCL6729701.1 hypothetical protein [Sphingomonas hankyongi]